jgi:non-specific serine/threonine protein kinase
MLETIREFGLAQIEGSGETTAVREAHATWFAALAGANAPMEFGQHRAPGWLDRMEVERQNLRAVLAWAEGREAELSLALASALWYFWWARGPVSEGRAWLDRALHHGDRSESRPRAAALYAAALLAYVQSDYVRATALAEESAMKFRAMGDRAGTALALLALGEVPLDQGDNARAAAIYGEAVSLAREVGTPWLVTVALNNFAMPVGVLGDYPEVKRLSDEALRIASDDGDAWGMAYALANLSGAAREQGDYARAAMLGVEGLALARAAGNSRYVADALVGIAAIAVACRESRLAARLLSAADALCEAMGSPIYPHQVQYAQTVSAVRSTLGPEPFTAERNAGAKLSLDEAIEEAKAFVSAVEIITKAAPQSHGLTPRETEILRLVAAGQTDQQIADTLFVSRRTVTTHVANILGKLGAANRTEAAAVAVRMGLG